MTTDTTKAGGAEARWYSVSRFGVATLCVDERDARSTATQNDVEWPAGAPHRAVLMGDVGALLAALQPFVARNSSGETITITVRTADVARARAAIAAATGAQQ